jgi:pyruvate dehydrogenase E2 component (dihydrolipoamide acetyltransferase)
MATLVAHAAVTALGDHRRLNARYDEDDQTLVLLHQVHLGVAVDTERGLIVPVIRNAQALGLSEMAIRITELAHATRRGDLDPSSSRGATFSLTNVGAIGGSFFTPIIVPPQVAILGMGRVRSREQGGQEIHELPLSLSYDHRVIDGADAMRYLATVGRRLESPLTLA